MGNTKKTDTVTMVVTCAGMPESKTDVFDFYSEYLDHYKIDASSTIYIELDLDNDGITVQWQDTQQGLRKAGRIGAGEFIDQFSADHRTVVLSMIAFYSGYPNLQAA